MALWKIDPDHSVAVFAVKHFMITDVHGQFNRLSGTISFDPEKPLATALQVEIGVDSLFTGVAKRDAHLRSPDFFDAERFPVMRFQSKSVELTAWNGFKIAGSMEIRGVTRDLILGAEVRGPVKGPEALGGETCISFNLAGRLNRKDYGVAWHVPLEKNGVVAGWEVRLWVSLEADLVSG